MKILNLIKQLNKNFGSTWLEIEEPETLSIMLKNAHLDEISMDIINALKTIVINNSAWKNIFIFENVVDALNGDPIIPETVTKPPIENICYAVEIMQFLRPEVLFSSDVKKYIAALAIDEQLVYLPAPLEFVNSYLNVNPLLQKEVKDLFDVNKINIEYPYKETPIDIQLQKLYAIWSTYLNKI